MRDISLSLSTGPRNRTVVLGLGVVIKPWEYMVWSCLPEMISQSYDATQNKVLFVDEPEIGKE